MSCLHVHGYHSWINKMYYAYWLNSILNIIIPVYAPAMRWIREFFWQYCPFRSVLAAPRGFVVQPNAQCDLSPDNARSWPPSQHCSIAHATNVVLRCYQPKYAIKWAVSAKFTCTSLRRNLFLLHSPTKSLTSVKSVTKNEVVPSCLSKWSGNNFIHVSSPKNIIRFSEYTNYALSKGFQMNWDWL